MPLQLNANREMLGWGTTEVRKVQRVRTKRIEGTGKFTLTWWHSTRTRNGQWHSEEQGDKGKVWNSGKNEVK